MSKIICDVCGTTYQDTAECCPICGCTKDDAAAMLSDEQMLDDLISGKSSGPSAKKRKEIFDFDEVNTIKETVVEEEVNPYEEEEEYYAEPAQHNTLAVVLLTILIVVLLGAAAFLFIRFYLPGISEEEAVTVPTTVTEPAVYEETTIPGIPCESLALTSGMATGDSELLSPGQKFLINVIASPADTTDAITFVSEDESVATVTADGQVTAVGEGETVIQVSCGQYQIPCKVVCNFSKETEPPTEATVAPTEAQTLPEVELKLKKTDVMLTVYYEFQLMLDCELEQTDVKWRSEHPHIASVDADGVVRALQPGTTSIIAEYGGQSASCIVRCHY